VEQRERLAKLRTDRDTGAVTAGLDALRRTAEGTGNVLYPMREALRARSTVGEVCHALREVWGTYRPPDLF
jgi:methylmalonyl-CoA mutase N-terminal domain/subunit